MNRPSLLALLLAEMLVPLHDRHQIKQNCASAQHQRQDDVAFAAFLGCPLVISHVHSGARFSSRSTISAAKGTNTYNKETPNSRLAEGSRAGSRSRQVEKASSSIQNPMLAEAM